MHAEQSLFTVKMSLHEYVGEIRNTEFSRERIIFRKEEDKYYLETLVWDILFRLEAGAYHHDNVIDLVNKTLDRLKTSIGDLSLYTSGSMTFKVTIENKPIIFELIAFLVSIRSMLDTLTELVSFYLKGMNFHSIADLNKYLEKEYPKKGRLIPFEVFTIVNQHWIDWIKNLRDYRDDLVHEITILSSAEYEMMSIPIIRNGKKISKKIESFPNFFIPKEPKFEFILEGFEKETPFEKTTSITEVKNSNGEVVYRDVSIEKKIDDSQMIEIKSFVNFYFERATDLITQIVTSLRKNRFVYLTLE